MEVLSNPERLFSKRDLDIAGISEIWWDYDKSVDTMEKKASISSTEMGEHQAHKEAEPRIKENIQGIR